MSCELSSENIYGYCMMHKVKYRYIGEDKKGRAMVQCPKCFEKRIVPKSWVKRLTPIEPMEKPIWNPKPKREKGRSQQAIAREILKEESRERASSKRWERFYG